MASSMSGSGRSDLSFVHDGQRENTFYYRIGINGDNVELGDLPADVQTNIKASNILLLRVNHRVSIETRFCYNGSHVQVLHSSGSSNPTKSKFGKYENINNLLSNCVKFGKKVWEIVVVRQNENGKCDYIRNFEDTDLLSSLGPRESLDTRVEYQLNFGRIIGTFIDRFGRQIPTDSAACCFQGIHHTTGVPIRPGQQNLPTLSTTSTT